MFGRRRNTNPAPDPRPIAVDGCDYCAVGPGGRHEWSCDEVPADLFVATFGAGTPDAPSPRSTR